MSGIVFNDEQPNKKQDKFVTLFVFHFDISGINFNDEQL